jgi:hypothetical protein
VAFAIARREAPCTTTCRSSLDSDVDNGARVDPDAVGIEIEVMSRVVVRCGAASVGAANVPCRGGERVDLAAAGIEAVVRVDLIDTASDSVVIGAGGVVSSTFTLVGPRLVWAGFRIEIPRVPNTLLADLRRASRRMGTAVDDGVSEGRALSGSWPEP